MDQLERKIKTIIEHKTHKMELTFKMTKDKSNKKSLLEFKIKTLQNSDKTRIPLLIRNQDINEGLIIKID